MKKKDQGTNGAGGVVETPAAGTGSCGSEIVRTLDTTVRNRTVVGSAEFQRRALQRRIEAVFAERGVTAIRSTDVMKAITVSDMTTVDAVPDGTAVRLCMDEAGSLCMCHPLPHVANMRAGSDLAER